MNAPGRLRPSLAGTLLGPLLGTALIAPALAAEPQSQLLRRTVAPLGGGLDRVLLVNDNNPELVREAGILISSFDGARGPGGRALGVPGAHLNVPLTGQFDLFSHHVYAGRPENLDSTLWMAVVAAPRGSQPVQLRLLQGATALSQSVDPGQSAAPFLPLPPLMRQQGGSPVWSGPGSRVATELLNRERSPLLPRQWTLAPGRLSTLVVLPLPVRGLDPLLNGRNLQMRLESSGPVDLATLAAFGPLEQPPPDAVWAELLEGGLSPREHSPSPRGSRGPLVYSRVSGVQIGSTWTGRLTDSGGAALSVRRAPISWPISSLERGSLGTGQVQTAELQAFYPDTAWAAHGNYGVEYRLSLPLINDTARAVMLQLALESPLKNDAPLGGLRFRTSPGPAVMFRGPVEVAGLDDGRGRASGRQRFHLVLRAGEAGPALGTISLAAGEQRLVQVRLIYPADATPPQVLSLLPLSAEDPSGGAVKQSGAMPAAIP
ncbi:MAG TPA: DUF3370 domain-containing protein [Cyanobium sp.]|nr:DUF3370 domain-containing protein [Cyanobium sp.]